MVSSNRRSRRPIASAPPSKSATRVQAVTQISIGFEAPSPITLNDPILPQLPSEVLYPPPPGTSGPLPSASPPHQHTGCGLPTHLIQPRWIARPPPQDPRRPPSTVSGSILRSEKPPRDLRVLSRWLPPPPQNPRPPWWVPWIPSTNSAATCSGALNPIVSPQALRGPLFPGVQTSEHQSTSPHPRPLPLPPLPPREE
jgi:hypothetical protein